MDAKSFFREGYVMLLRPFDFGDLDVPLQKLTIAYAYVVEPLYKEFLTDAAQDRLDMLDKGAGFTKVFHRDDYEDLQVQAILDSPSSYRKEHIGFKVQININGTNIYLFPDEYNLIDSKKLEDILSEDGYHVICNERLYKIKEYRDKYHYLLSRGLSKEDAKKWASIGYGDLVYYKPYYQLLEMFCRDHEILPDPFYNEIEGIEI